MTPDKLEALRLLAPVIGIVGVSGMIGWVATTWLRIKNGYPLDGAWGQAVYPKATPAESEAVRRLATENTALRDELESVHARLATLESIITDRGVGVATQIEALRDPAPARPLLADAGI